MVTNVSYKIGEKDKRKKRRIYIRGVKKREKVCQSGRIGTKRTEEKRNDGIF